MERISRFSSRTRRVVAYLPLTFTMLVAALACLPLIRLQSARLRARQARTAVAVTRSLLAAVETAEAGERGYLLTERASYLDPYGAGSAAASRQLATLRGLAVDAPSLRPHTERAAPLVSARLAELARTVTLVQRGLRAAALDSLQSGRGQITMASLRVELSGVQSAADAAERRWAAVQERAQRVLVLVAVLGGLGLALTVVLVDWMLRSYAAAQAAAAAAASALRGVFEVGEALAASITVDEVGAVVCEWSRRVLGADHVVVAELSDDGGSVVPVAGLGAGSRYVEEGALPLMEPAALSAAARTHTVIRADTEAECQRAFPHTAGMAIRCVAALPLRVEGRTIGAYGVAFEREHALTAGHIELMEAVSLQCGQALVRAQLYHAERDARATAEEANASRLGCVRLVSYDLRTPLNSILGYTELLQDGLLGPLEDRQRATLARIRASTEILRAQIDEALEFTRVEAGQVRLAVVDVPIAKALERAIELVRPRANEKQISLAVGSCNASLAVRADQRSLVRVLANLLSRATSCSPPGATIHLTIETVDHRLRLSIDDAGPGLPPEEVEWVFEPLGQLDRPDRLAATNGAGFGLSNCRRLARAMGGDLSASAGREGGSVFTLELPLSDAADPVGPTLPVTV